MVPDVQLELLAQLVKILHRITPINTRRVDDVDERARPLDVAQKVVAEPAVVVRAVNQTREVGDREPLEVRVLDDPDVGLCWGSGAMWFVN